ncbi:MAG: nitroreductase family protein, partial [Clostridiales bacterium]|nr:nitroreductase family protein [Clostridiales bacterium]MDY5702683.1 nitroreductase family protein [Eubacteriales bacterium]
MTATIETMLARSSIRAYTDEKLTDDELILLKKAALSAPTAMNRNDQRFVFVTDGAVISKVEQEVIAGVKAKGDTVFLERILSRGGKVAYDAPLLVIIFGKPSRYAGIDAGIAVQNLALAAKSLDLGSVILGMPSIAFEGSGGAELQEKLGVEPEFGFEIAIAIGHSATEKTPHEWD